MNAYDIEIEYDQENDNYYAEHEFSYPSKRVRLNIDTDNSLWPTDESNSMTITIPSNPQTDTNNTWDDTTKTLTLTNLDQNTLITNNQNPSFNYATDLNINLSNYQSSVTPSKINIKSISNSKSSISNTIDINSLNKQLTSGTISLNRYDILIYFLEYNSGYYDGYYEIGIAYNNSGSGSKSINVPADSRYYVARDVTTGYIHLYDENNKDMIWLQDNNVNDNSATTLYLNKNFFNIILD